MFLRTLSVGLMKCGRAKCKEAEATRKDFNIVLALQDKKFFISELAKVIQDAISLILHYKTMYPERFCAFSTLVKHQNTVSWVDINLAQGKELKFYKTRSNAIILHETLPSYCIPKAIKMENGEVIYEKVYMSPRPPPKISLKNDWMKELGSEVARQSEGSQPTQPNPNPIHRTGRPVGGHWSPQLDEIDIDFRVSGLPHAVVKQAENFRVREFVKKIESSSSTRFSSRTVTK